MPLYEYLCDACGHRFEAIQRFSDAPLDTCPKCGGRVRKLQSAPAFQFKGSGWYVTDYAKKDGAGGDKSPDTAAGKDSKSSKETPAASESGAAAKTDTPTSTPTSSSEPTKGAG
jgi:putative FmdB family regulatory protein